MVCVILIELEALGLYVLLVYVPSSYIWLSLYLYVLKVQVQ